MCSLARRYPRSACAGQKDGARREPRPDMNRDESVRAGSPCPTAQGDAEVFRPQRGARRSRYRARPAVRRGVVSSVQLPATLAEMAKQPREHGLLDSEIILARRPPRLGRPAGSRRASVHVTASTPI
jgi:hypothetical protein